MITFFPQAVASPSSSSQKNTWTGSRTTPVHRIPLRDEFGQEIIPTERHPLPFSSRASCAPCHDYEIIRHGLHFNDQEAKDPGRAGEPWVWLDEKTGTILPLSYRGWKHAWNPKELGLSGWHFTLLFGRHLAGGGVAEPPTEKITQDSRWEVAGKIEINCLGCHNASGLQDHSEWAKQVLRENFRWAATASSGLGDVGGMASRLRGTWDIYDGPNPDDSEWAVAPFVRYNKTFFDGKHRAFLEILRKPEDRLCLACHSVSEAGAKKHESESDVHGAAGLRCADCHRNDISHAMVRGYEGEFGKKGQSAEEEFTCRGCHLGGRKERFSVGRLGAPYPRHRGIPKVHFDRLACTVCHAGPPPGKQPTRVRTARANRLEIFGIAQWATDLPAVFEPVYVRDEATDKITPHRIIWPAFWAKLEDGKATPLNPEEVLKEAGWVFDAEETAVRILSALAGALEQDEIPLIITGNKAFTVNVDGRLEVSTSPDDFPSDEIILVSKKGETITPLIPEFDPEDQEPDADAEARIQTILQALGGVQEPPGTPALVIKKTLFRMTEGYLEKTESPESPAGLRLAWLREGKILPALSDLQKRVISEIVGTEYAITEEQAVLVLNALFKAAGGEGSEKTEYVYVSSGKMFRLSSKGKLKAGDHQAAEAVAWPLGHRVRPARQSLGSNGCTDCHSAGSDFFFSRVKASGPLKTTVVEARTAHVFMGLDMTYQFLFGASFAARPLFKALLFVAALIISGIVFIVFFVGLGRAAGLLEKRR